MNTITELLEVLGAFGITQCESCNVWGEGMNIDESAGVMKCANCTKLADIKEGHKMGKNTFDVEQTFKRLDKERGKKPAPAIIGDYYIEPTGLDGWMTYRYQYKVGVHDYFGYAESIEEARAIIINAQKVGA